MATSREDAMGAFTAGTAGLSGKRRAAMVLKRRADDARIQQLRGIFAAYDEDRDGYLTPSELTSALLSLGFEPTSRAIQRFELAAPNGRVDLATFVRVCMGRSGASLAIAGTPSAAAAEAAAAAGDSETTEAAVIALFRSFDPSSTGRIPLSQLLHVLCEVESPTALSVEEVHELLRMTGILNSSTAADPRALYGMEVDYAALVRHMLFPAPRLLALPAAPAAAPAATAVSQPSPSPARALPGPR